MGNKNGRRFGESNFREANASDHTLLRPISKLDNKAIRDFPVVFNDSSENVSKPLRSAARTHVMSK